MNFGYLESGEKKNALVKVSVCKDCAFKLNYKKVLKEVKPWSFSASLIVLKLVLFDKTTKLTNFIMFSLVKIKSVAFPVSDLQQVVVQSLFDYSDLICCVLEVHVHDFSRFI